MQQTRNSSLGFSLWFSSYGCWRALDLLPFLCSAVERMSASYGEKTVRSSIYWTTTAQRISIAVKDGAPIIAGMGISRAVGPDISCSTD